MSEHNLLPAVCRYLTEKCGILHLSHEPATRKNEFLAQILLSILNSTDRVFFCDTHQNFSRNLFKPYLDRIFWTRIGSSQELIAKLHTIEHDLLYEHEIIVIDSISDLFQQDCMNENPNAFRTTVQLFFEHIITPLNLLVTHQKASFILVHNCTYHPKLNQTMPVQYELMSLAKGVWLSLSKLVVEGDAQHFTYQYQLKLRYALEDQTALHIYRYDFTPSFTIEPPRED